MKEKFVAFITDPGPETFLAVRERIIRDAAYDPYSDDLDILDQLFVKEAYQEIADHRGVNILLSPLAHLIKSVAYEKLEMQEEAEGEMHMWQLLLKSIEQTGNGTQESPYLVTRISDEKDFIDYLEETFAGQLLIERDHQQLDRISLASGRDIYFDITACYRRPATAAAAPEEKIPVIVDQPEPVLPEEKPQPVHEAPAPFVAGAEDFLPEEEEEIVEKKKWWKFW
jgi:hypothetical protein